MSSSRGGGAPDDVEHVKTGEHEARQEGTRVKLHHGDVCRRRVDDQHDRWRNEDAEAAAGADDACRIRGVVAGLEHLRKGEQAHQRYDRADDARCCCEQRAGQ